MKGTTNNMNMTRSLSAGVFAVLAIGCCAGKASAQFTFSGADFSIGTGTLTGSGPVSYTPQGGSLIPGVTFSLTATQAGDTVSPGPPITVINGPLTALTATFSDATDADLLTITAPSGDFVWDSFTDTVNVDFSPVTLTSDDYSFSGANDFGFSFTAPSLTSTGGHCKWCR
jgi:hypothetical protein